MQRKKSKKLQELGFFFFLLVQSKQSSLKEKPEGEAEKTRYLKNSIKIKGLFLIKTVKSLAEV